MGMSDCSKCWDTPCICGHGGYTVVWHKDEYAYLIPIDEWKKDQESQFPADATHVVWYNK